MADSSEADDSAVVADADDIASKITQFLFESFRAKTGRNPDNNEIEQLFDELTPERVAELLGEVNIPVNQDDAEGSSGDDDENDDEDDHEEVNELEVGDGDDLTVPSEAPSTVVTEEENKTEVAVSEIGGEKENLKRISPEENLVSVDDSQNVDKRVRQ